MPSNVVEIDEPETTIASLYELEAEQMLVASARSGDAQAFEMLVKRLEPRILALRYTSVREDAEDVVQQSLQKAFVYLHGFRREVQIFHLAYADRDQRGVDVDAEETRLTRGPDRGSSHRGRNRSAAGFPGLSREP